MDIAGIQSGMVGMALFDSWYAAVQKSRKSHGVREGDPLVAAAAEAFEQYIGTVEMQNGAMIAGLATYALTPRGNGAQLITQAQMAPFLAMNVLA